MDKDGGVEGGSADEGAVEIILGEKVVNIFRVDRTAVEDGGGTGSERFDFESDLIGDFGGVGFAGADSGEGLEGEDDFGKIGEIVFEESNLGFEIGGVDADDGGSFGA